MTPSGSGKWRDESVADRPRVYMAGPVQHSEDAETWRDALRAETTGFEWVNPLDKYNALDDVQIEYTEMNEATRSFIEDSGGEVVPAKSIVEADIDMIRHSDAVLARFDGSLTIGTPMEMRIAYAEMNMPVVLWRADGEWSPWAWCHYDAIRHSRGAALDALRRLLDDRDRQVPRASSEVDDESSDSSGPEGATGPEV
jgi:nucleoside 2-deoxyribosyltransferase